MNLIRLQIILQQWKKNLKFDVWRFRDNENDSSYAGGEKKD